jgi:ferrous iron transport protein A
MTVVTLDTLAPGESGRVVRVHGRGAVRRRLVDMGLTSGVVIEVVKLSPLGDPVEYRLRGYHLSLRTSEARTIEVELLDDDRKPPRREGNRGIDQSLVRCQSGQQFEIIQTRGVVRNDFPGPLILADPSGERVVVGKGMARHIQVKGH